MTTPMFRVYDTDVTGMRVYEALPGITNREIESLVVIATKEAEKQVFTKWEFPVSIPKSGMRQILEFFREYKNVGWVIVHGRVSAEDVFLFGDVISKYTQHTDLLHAYPLSFDFDFSVFTDFELALRFAKQIVNNTRSVCFSPEDRNLMRLTQDSMRAFLLLSSIDGETRHIRALITFASGYHIPQKSFLKNFLTKDGDFSICRRIYAFLIEYKCT